MCKKKDIKTKLLIEKIDNPKRIKVLPIDKTIEKLDINSGFTIVDIGCGVGYFTIPLSKISKKVYGIDVSGNLLKELKKRYNMSGIKNIVPIITNGTLKDIKQLNADYAFMCTVLHEIDDKENFLIGAKDLLKDDASLCIIEFYKERKSLGPPSSTRIGIDEVKGLCESLDLIEVKRFNISEEVYGIIFKKQNKNMK